MIRSRIFRLRSFWLGLPGLLFLVWAWADSMSYQSGVVFKQSLSMAPGSKGSFNHFAGQSGGAFRVNWWSFDEATRTRLVSSEFKATREAEPMVERFPAPGMVTLPRHEFYPGILVGAKRLTLPHWLLILVYLALWGWLILRRWKAARKMEADLAGGDARFEDARPKAGG